MSNHTPSGQSRLTALAVVVTLALVAVAVVQVTRQPSGSSPVGLQLPAPPGWQVLDGPSGRMMALTREGFQGDVPSGPRVVVRSSNQYSSAAIWAGGVFKNYPPGSTTLREGPAPVMVGGISATQVTMQAEVDGRSLVSRHVIVPLGNGRSALVTYEGPPDQFAANEPAFTAALKAATFPR
jgi:hypothetical protein